MRLATPPGGPTLLELLGGFDDCPPTPLLECGIGMDSALTLKLLVCLREPCTPVFAPLSAAEALFRPPSCLSLDEDVFM